MPLWHNPPARRRADSGKFHHMPRMGTAHSAAAKHKSWSYHFAQHQTGASVQRSSYSVTINDPNGHRAQYLAGFTSLAQAGAAAREWIDRMVEKIERR